MKLRFAPAYQEVAPYAPSKAIPDLRLDLAGNEGRGLDLDLALEATRDQLGNLRRYPDIGALTEAIARLRQVAPEQVLPTNGGDDAIDRICRVALCPGRNAVVPSPTFEMIPRYVHNTGATLRAIPGIRSHFVSRVLDAVDDDTGLIAIVTPNNPTGEVVPVDEIVTIASVAPEALVLADLAYIEFADEDPTQRLLELPNVVVTRTLSKAWGLAGLRLGYALGAPEILQRLRAAGGPYAVSSLSAAIATRWIDAGGVRVQAFIEEVRRESGLLREALLRAGWPCFESQANFVTVNHAQVGLLAQGLLDQGIRIRIWPQDPERNTFARITCPGDAGEFDQLLEAVASLPPAPTP